MRNAQNRAHKRAIKQALVDQNRGLFAVIAKFNRLHLALILFALSLSIILLFVGTFAYFHIHISKSESSSFYNNILNILNVDSVEFDVLTKLDSSNNQTSKQSKFTNLKFSNLLVNFITNSGIFGKILSQFLMFYLKCTFKIIETKQNKRK